MEVGGRDMTSSGQAGSLHTASAKIPRDFLGIGGVKMGERGWLAGCLKKRREEEWEGYEVEQRGV